MTLLLLMKPFYMSEKPFGSYFLGVCAPSSVSTSKPILHREAVPLLQGDFGTNVVQKQAEGCGQNSVPDPKEKWAWAS